MKKLTSAWEKKNSKTARAGGASLMALSLAACGGEDNTPFSAADVSAAEAAATTAALTGADGTVYASVDAAVTSNDTAIADAARAEGVASVDITSDNTEVMMSQADYDAAIDAADDAVQASLDALQATYDALKVSYDSIVAPKELALSSAAAADTLVGGSGNDVFSGSGSAIDAADKIIDESTADADVANLTMTGDSGSIAAAASGVIVIGDLVTNALSVSNVETINVTVEALTGTAVVDTANMSGVTTLNVGRGNPTVAGSTLVGGTGLSIDNIDVDNTPTINVTTAVATLDLAFDGASDDGATVTADLVTGNIASIDGGLTLNAAATTGDIFVYDESGVSNDTAVVINAANATDIDVGQANNIAGGPAVGVPTITAANAKFNGEVTVNAAAALTVEVNTSGAQTIDAANANDVDVDDASGGATVTAGVSNTADTVITLVDIDNTGATITTGTGVAATTATAKQIDIDIDGTAASTDTATISGAGVISLDHDKGNGGVVEILNLSGTTAAVTYDFDSADALTTITGSGDQLVNVILDADVISGASTAVTGVNNVTIDAKTTDATVDIDKSSVAKYIVTADIGGGASNEVTLADSQTVEFKINQTLVDIDVAGTTTDNVSIIAGDVNGSATTVGTLDLGTSLTTSEATANSATTGDTRGGTVTITAIESNLTVDTFAAWSQNVVVTGDENISVTTGLQAQSYDGTQNTGVQTLTVIDSTVGTSDTATVTTGAGNDVLTANTSGKIEMTAGGGNDNITITDAGASSVFSGQEGVDTFLLTESATAYVVSGGSGNDHFDVNVTAQEAVIVGGEGDDDTLDIGAILDTSSSTNFAISGIEVIELNDANGTVVMTAAQFANNNTVKLEGTSDDGFQVNASATTGSTIDATGVTTDSTQAITITYQGAAKADSITGGATDETLSAGASAGNGGGSDAYDGGAGTDTFVATAMHGVTETGSAAASTGVVINLGSTAVSGTTVFAQVDDYISGGLTEVAAGTGTYTYAANSALNAATVSTFANIENITGTQGGDYIVGTGGANTITGGAGVDYLAGGLGVDVFVQTYTDVDTTAGAVTDIIGDWAAGDQIKVGTAGAGATYSEAGATVADLATLLTAAGTALDGTVKIYVGQVTGGASYAVLDDDGTGYTSVIQLDGVALADIAAADFIA